MSLEFAAIVPHPPLLIPTIGKDAIKKVNKTKIALEKLEEDLYVCKPDIILIISPHGSLFTDSFTINVNPEFETDLREFGDISTKMRFKGEMSLAARIHKAAQAAEIPSTMISEKFIDHGVAVPLFYLTKHLENSTILPIGFSGLDRKTHADFGYIIKDAVFNTNKRVAVLASGDLSHALTTDSPAGYNAAGVEFDEKIQTLLSTGNAAGMVQLDPKLIESAAECGLRSFLILMGVLNGINYTYKSYSYEGPFGVGYLVANFVL